TLSSAWSSMPRSAWIRMRTTKNSCEFIGKDVFVLQPDGLVLVSAWRRGRPFAMITLGTGEAHGPSRGLSTFQGQRFMAKHIFVTGGVVSSLGKGLTCASVGMLLERR